MCGLRRIRVLLVDDHQVVRHGVRLALEATPDIMVVGEGETADQALSMLRELLPDVMLCDVRLPGLSGIEVVRRASDYSPRTRSLVLSAYDDDEYVFEAMAAGASGFLLKTIDVKKLPEAVRRADSGETVLYPPTSAQFARMLSGDTSTPKNEPLTSREREILALAAQGLKNQPIAEKLGLSVRTVEGHLARIFVKLSVSSRLQAVRVASAKGLFEEGDEGREKKAGS